MAQTDRLRDDRFLVAIAFRNSTGLRLESLLAPLLRQESSSKTTQAHTARLKEILNKPVLSRLSPVSVSVLMTTIAIL